MSRKLFEECKLRGKTLQRYKVWKYCPFCGKEIVFETIVPPDKPTEDEQWYLQYIYCYINNKFENLVCNICSKTYVSLGTSIKHLREEHHMKDDREAGKYVGEKFIKYKETVPNDIIQKLNSMTLPELRAEEKRLSEKIKRWKNHEEWSKLINK